MGKKDKEHRKKVEKRNNLLKHKKRILENSQKRILMDIIQKEKEAGLFDNNPIESTDSPIIGPQI